ncbi:hypothetical protein C8R47DRAFT_1074857 [Mycena vitilis]|nr:hypothetical protein C8R47DRAFT_1074857 [Mycena vitilis]
MAALLAKAHSALGRRRTPRTRRTTPAPRNVRGTCPSAAHSANPSSSRIVSGPSCLSGTHSTNVYDWYLPSATQTIPHQPQPQPRTAGEPSAIDLVARIPHLQLARLAPHYVLVPSSFHLNREGHDAARCRQYLACPDLVLEYDVHGLAERLRSRNVQAVVAQLVARRFGWWVGSPAPFLNIDTAHGRSAYEAMVAQGMAVDAMSCQCEAKLRGSPGMFDLERASMRWLAKQWDGAGRPAVPGPEWDAVVELAITPLFI